MSNNEDWSVWNNYAILHLVYLGVVALIDIFDIFFPDVFYEKLMISWRVITNIKFFSWFFIIPFFFITSVLVWIHFKRNKKRYGILNYIAIPANVFVWFLTFVAFIMKISA